ncbi:glycosyltransferase family 4 protein [Dietzia sp. 111N12-1]|uniref:glycosyltransferase family 4 protein n=1 Tax=Dietzia sp. 111N12-1 TaxID=1785156 RepID=UPI0012E70FCD|nr:glycosyltransferase family 4 protein [Dietzia sp. 111N12-1]
MRELAARGYPVTVFTSDANHLASPPRFRGLFHVQHLDGLPVVWVRGVKYRSVRSLRRIISWCQFEIGLLVLPHRRFVPPDVIVASSLSLLSVVSGFLLSRRYRAKFVFEVRDIWPLTLTEEGGFSSRNLFVRLLSRLERFGYEKADVIVGTMPNLEEHVRKVSGATAPVVCIPMGFDERDLVHDSVLPDELRRAWPSGKKFVIGYAGSIGATNALDVLFECVDLLRDNSDLHFVVMGDGDLLSSYIDSYSHLENLTFTGRIPKQILPAALALCDVLYLSMFDSEVWEYGQSLNKLIDYMLAGKPVVASYSGYPSMLNESGSGVFVPAGDSARLAATFRALAEMDDSVLGEMGARGRHWLLSNRSYSKLADDYLSLVVDRDGPISSTESGRESEN